MRGAIPAILPGAWPGSAASVSIPGDALIIVPVGNFVLFPGVVAPPSLGFCLALLM